MVTRSTTTILFLLFTSLLLPITSAETPLEKSLKTFSKTIKKAGVVDTSSLCDNCAKTELKEETKKDNLYSSYNKKTIELSVINYEKALNLFWKIKNNKDIPFEYTPEGCFARAHQTALMLDREGVTSGKAFLEGIFYVKTKTYQENLWGYHVANVILVEKDKKVTPMIIDPSLFDRPVAYEDWKNYISSSMPNSKLFTEYFTKRFNYFPDSRHDDLIDYLPRDIRDSKAENFKNKGYHNFLQSPLNKGNKP